MTYEESSLALIETTPRLKTVDQVIAFLNELQNRLEMEEGESKGKEKWRLNGQRQGITSALNALEQLPK